MGRQAASTRARWAGAHDHAKVVRLEGRKVDQEDRVSRRRQERILGRSRLLEHGRTLVQRSIYVLTHANVSVERRYAGDSPYARHARGPAARIPGAGLRAEVRWHPCPR